MQSETWANNLANAYLPSVGTEPKYDEYDAKKHHLLTREVPKKVLVECGHKLDTAALPPNKCLMCWGKFFTTNVEMTKQNISVFVNGGKDEITAKLGSRYTRMLGLFTDFVKAANELSKVEETNAEVV